ncbi:16843_t:CDS:2 [Dentiscutata heterogama]|uniref:16843_t:CDS:1 n=1 Tax=Dentiscutata heterogama TaxID=1316150 RepID=A0ACA9L4R3_9GLOM|nr:16843_t:CDS:2 [Dentiscutata heterogama]
MNNQHYLKNASDHNHLADASRLEVVKTITKIKEQAQRINDKPAQIMQTAITNSSQYIYSYLLLTNTLRKTIQRIHHLDLLTEPGSLENFEEEYNIDLQPQIVLTDFESAAINAVQLEFNDAQNKGCYFHLAQSIYHKVQNCRLSSRYSTDELFSLLIRHIPALAFLPYNEIPGVFNKLNSFIPSEAHEVVNSNVIRSEPLFPSKFWSVANNVKFVYPRTQNSGETWHRQWETLVSSAHVDVFRIIKKLQKEQNQIELNIEAILKDAPRLAQR